MLFLFLAFSFSTKPRLALGIWSGKENIGSRVLSQAKTWMKFWNEIYVFSDEIPEEAANKVRKEAHPCKVHFVQISNYSEHLEDTEWQNRWYFAQPRFLPSMHKLWELEPNVSWYLFGDDDTYFFKEPIIRKLSSYNPREKWVIGKVWCSNSKFSKILNRYKCIPFAQGGAGIAISSQFMNEISGDLLKCNKQFNDPDFPGSMRFAFCAERKFGKSVWDPDQKLVAWSEGFHSDPPDKEFHSKQITEAPASFHRVFPDDFKAIYDVHAAEYIYDKQKYLADLSFFSFTRHRIPLGSLRTRFDWIFGYCISEPKMTDIFLTPDSKWEVEVSQKGEIKRFTQKYNRGVSISLQCDENIMPGNIRFSSFLDEEGSNPLFNVSCSVIPVIKL